MRALGTEAPNILLPAGGNSSYWHNRRDGEWARYLLHEAIPEAVAKTGADPKRVAIGGVSMGGFGALALALQHPGAVLRRRGDGAGALEEGATRRRPARSTARPTSGATTSWRRPRQGWPFGSTRIWLDVGTHDPFRANDCEARARSSAPRARFTVLARDTRERLRPAAHAADAALVRGRARRVQIQAPRRRVGLRAMPLYMDMHTFDGGVSLEDVMEAHRKDLEVQGKHGVDYKAYWVDESSGKVFCLVEAPDAESARPRARRGARPRRRRHLGSQAGRLSHRAYNRPDARRAPHRDRHAVPRGRLRRPRAFRALASHLVDHGSDGIVVAGTTGESPTLSDDEKLALFEAAVDELRGRATVVAGTGTYDTAHSVHLTERAHELGVDGFLVVTPYYNKPPQRGIVAHFRAIAEASDKPIVVYNIPGRVIVNIEPETIVELAEIP